MHLVLFYLQKYYKKLRSRSLSNGASPKLNGKSLSGSLLLNGGVSPVSPACGTPDQFEWKWYNLESPRLSASLGTNEFSSLPLVLQAAKSADLKLLKELIDKGKICQKLRECQLHVCRHNFKFICSLTHWLSELFAKRAFLGHFGGFQAGSRPK